MTLRPSALATSLALLALTSSAQADPTVGATTVLGPFVGPGATLHTGNRPPANPSIAFAGTDLGWTYTHAGTLRVLFGDTHASEAGAPIDPKYFGTVPEGSAASFDDGFGQVDLSVWSDPASFSSTNLPKILLAQHPGSSDAKALNPQHWMDAFKTPFGGFSNGSREFALFYTSKPEGCLNDGHCDDHHSMLTCDPGLAFWFEEYFDQKAFTGGCLDGTFGCLNDTRIDAWGFPVPGTGFCRDATSTLYRNDAVGRVLATATKHRIGIRSLTDAREYLSIQQWLTSKFRNVTIATAQDFVPSRGAGYRSQSYGEAGSSGANRRVFLWGRPSFVGIKATGRSNGLYFAYVDMPAGSTLTGWAPKYYTGTIGGVPQFSTLESAAVALDLDASTAGIQTSEPHDIVSLTNVVWVDALKKWVMLYGGSLSTNPVGPFVTCGVLEFFVGAQECGRVARGNHAIRMRTADDPWGPWSVPRDFYVPGDPLASVPTGAYNGAVQGQNIFYHPRCTGTCRASYGHPNYDPSVEFGVPYAPMIVVPWIKPAAGAVDVTWLMSTWNPYGIYLMRTRIQPG